MPETVTVAGDNISLDLLLWRRYGVSGQTLVVATYQLNPGLASFGPVIPPGTSVMLPDAPSPTTTVAAPVDLFA